jgi:GT2 family glycosyltransferase
MSTYRPIFHFLGYITPTWYFNLIPNGTENYFVDPDELSVADRVLITPDSKFQSEEARRADLSWQALCKGIMFPNGAVCLKPSQLNFPLVDEYRFVQKYFHPMWSYYLLLLRLLTLHTPWKEFSAFLKTRDVKRVKVYEKHKDWITLMESFDSFLINSNPLVSVVIPTLNRYPWLKDVLKDLELQDFHNFEVIIVDQSEPFDANFYEGWKLKLRVWHQKEKALWKARNDAISASEGEYILLYDDDSRVERDWVSWHLKALDFFQSDISSGVSISLQGAKVPENYAFFRWSDQLDTGNVLIKKNVFKKIGLFDRQFEKQRMGDGEFGLRAYLHGFKNISNPQAKRIHLKVGEGGLRQMSGWDGWRPKHWWEPRPVPSVLYFILRYFNTRVAFQSILNNIPHSLIPYRWKNRKSFFLLYLPLFFFMLPIVIFQLVLSWQSAVKMKRSGHKISFN